MVGKHALKLGILPVVSYLGPAAARIMMGSIVVETIFAIPGLGRYLVNGAFNRDYTLVMGVVLFYAAFLMVLNLLVDVAYTLARSARGAAMSAAGASARCRRSPPRSSRRRPRPREPVGRRVAAAAPQPRRGGVGGVPAR